MKDIFFDLSTAHLCNLNARNHFNVYNSLAIDLCKFFKELETTQKHKRHHLGITKMKTFLFVVPRIYRIIKNRTEVPIENGKCKEVRHKNIFKVVRNVFHQGNENKVKR